MADENVHPIFLPILNQIAPEVHLAEPCADKEKYWQDLLQKALDEGLKSSTRAYEYSKALAAIADLALHPAISVEADKIREIILGAFEATRAL